MQPYDIVSKLWIEQCSEAFLKELVGARIKEFQPIEQLAQEQPAISKADYVLKAKTPTGASEVFVLEFLTRWETKKLIDFARYSLFCKKKFGVRIRPVLVLFKAHAQARAFYRDEIATFRFQLLKLYEFEAAKVFARRLPELYPLIPLMKGGVALAEEVNRDLLESELPHSKKADLLAVLSVFLGLRDKGLAAKVRKEQNARMNVMAESPVYQEIINLGRDQGRAEGRMEGRAEGRVEGQAQGRAEGRVEGLRKAIELGMEIRFGAAAKKIMPVLESCSDLAQLERAAEAVKTVRSVEQFLCLMRGPG
jgi:flagellar biosynthesis/type III secretory pathway protein FliH